MAAVRQLCGALSICQPSGMYTVYCKVTQHGHAPASWINSTSGPTCTQPGWSVLSGALLQEGLGTKYLMLLRARLISKKQWQFEG